MKDRAFLALHASVIGAWLGAATMVAFRVAPAAFEALPSRTEAGSFVGELLRVVYAMMLLAGGIAMYVPVKRGGRRARASAWIGAGLLGLASLSLFLAWKIASLRGVLGPIDELAPGDPSRQTFGALHGASILVLFAGMITALVALVVETVREPAGQATSASSSSASGNRQE